MPYQVYAKNLEVTPILQEYIDLKMKKLVRFMKADDNCQIDLSRDAHHKSGLVFRAEINMETNGKALRAEESSSDIRQSLDLARDKIIWQLNKNKEKIDSSKKRPGGKR